MTTRANARGALLAAALLSAGCAGASAPRVDELPLRGVDACGPTAGGALVAASDVAFAIDSSMSTQLPSGVDVDLDGETGRFDGVATSDRGDSMLAAQVAAVRSVLRSVRHRDARFSIVSYAGLRRFPDREPSMRLVSSREAALHADMTERIDDAEAALDRVLAGGSRGNTDFSAALLVALRTHAEAREAGTPRRKLVLLISDSPTPIVAHARHAFVRSDPFLSYPSARLLTAVRRARRAGVSVHTFGVGEAATAEPPHTLSVIARTTGGTHHAVRDPARLHCALLEVLSRS